MNTPWGASQYSTVYIEGGIVFHGTASHGGFKVYAKYNKQIPDYMRNKDGWYEEDCEWCKVAVNFPSVFNDKSNDAAIDTLKNWFPDEYEKFFLCKLDVQDSCVLKERAFIEKSKNSYVVTSALNNNGMVKVCAVRGGRLENGQFASRDEKWFMVPKDEYTMNFIIDESRHMETVPGF